MDATPCTDERGSATVYAVVLAVAVGVVAVIAAQCIALARIQHKAANAADLAAIAASQAAQAGRDGCEQARVVARRNAGEVESCVMADAVATVTVRIESPQMWGRTWQVEQRARAAPGDYTFEG
ncbi:MAG: Rv3654c family TadE-like protein [Nocardioidaceae bacterium]